MSYLTEAEDSDAKSGNGIVHVKPRSDAWYFEHG
jgi:hypothetical protein